MRLWFKGLKLKDSAQARDALNTVEAWRTQRQTPFHLVRAIRLYAALMRGDTSVMEEYFPLMRAVSTGRSAQPVMHLPPPVIEASGEGTVDDFLDGMGLDGLL